MWRSSVVLEDPGYCSGNNLHTAVGQGCPHNWNFLLIRTNHHCMLRDSNSRKHHTVITLAVMLSLSSIGNKLYLPVRHHGRSSCFFHMYNKDWVMRTLSPWSVTQTCRHNFESFMVFNYITWHTRIQRNLAFLGFVRSFVRIVDVRLLLQLCVRALEWHCTVSAGCEAPRYNRVFQANKICFPYIKLETQKRAPV